MAPRDDRRPPQRQREGVRTPSSAQHLLEVLDEDDDAGSSMLETDVMRFLAIMAFCLLVVFIPIVNSLSVDRTPDPAITAALPSTSPAATPSANPVMAPSPRPTAIETVVVMAVASPTVAATAPTPVMQRSPVPTSPRQPSLSPSRQPVASPSPVPSPTPPVTPEPAIAVPPERTAVPRPTLAPAPEPARWRVKFASDQAMVDLVSRGRVELFISTSGLVLAVRRDAEGRLAFERVDRLDIDFETYQMGEANVPADILWSFRRRHANLETSDWEFYVKLSDTIRSNLLRFMSDNSPGVVAIGADEKMRYE